MVRVLPIQEESHVDDKEDCGDIMGECRLKGGGICVDDSLDANTYVHAPSRINRGTIDFIRKPPSFEPRDATRVSTNRKDWKRRVATLIAVVNSSA